jgi:hypothetical protein
MAVKCLVPPNLKLSGPNLEHIHAIETEASVAFPSLSTQIQVKTPNYVTTIYCSIRTSVQTSLIYARLKKDAFLFEQVSFYALGAVACVVWG